MKTQDAKITVTTNFLTVTVTVQEGATFRTSVFRVKLADLEDAEVGLIGQAIDSEVRRRLSETWGGRVEDNPLF